MITLKKARTGAEEDYTTSFLLDCIYWSRRRLHNWLSTRLYLFQSILQMRAMDLRKQQELEWFIRP